MAVINQPKYMSFDHLYVETVTVTDPTNLNAGVGAHRFVTRTGAYPAAGGYAAGVSIYDIYEPVQPFQDFWRTGEQQPRPAGGEDMVNLGRRASVIKRDAHRAHKTDSGVENQVAFCWRNLILDFESIDSVSPLHFNFLLELDF